MAGLDSAFERVMDRRIDRMFPDEKQTAVLEVFKQDSLAASKQNYEALMGTIEKLSKKRAKTKDKKAAAIYAQMMESLQKKLAQHG